MKKIPAVCLALTMLFTTACGVQQTPVTGTATPTPEPSTPEAAGYANRFRTSASHRNGTWTEFPKLLHNLS